MRLLSRPIVEQKLRKENDELIDRNLRLRGFERAVTERLNTIKDSYEPEKVAKLQEYELFVQDILAKKGKLLRELMAIEEMIDQKKELYYGIIAKSDELAERKYQIEEETKKLNLREAFVTDLEQKWREKSLLTN